MDPLATGLLIVCTGKSTKKIDTYQSLFKEYTGTLRFGGTTPSYDAETEVDHHFAYDHISKERIQQVIEAHFLGEIEQVPPMFSAIKVDGQPLYKKARKGQSVAVKSRKVRIDEFDLGLFQPPELAFRIQCSKGTYIRSIAHDLGKALDSGAYLSSLRRTAIGEHKIEDAWNLEALCEHINLYRPISTEE